MSVTFATCCRSSCSWLKADTASGVFWRVVCRRVAVTMISGGSKVGLATCCAARGPGVAWPPASTTDCDHAADEQNASTINEPPPTTLDYFVIFTPKLFDFFEQLTLLF